ncbi:DUF1194 domain-containing protein [Oceanicella actignis]|uniref:VWFA domain-containing protein n=1 Tax=Oceanicella actignis TaxID=1189325 RepID=A0A1M7TYK3_9RHOB|nr:DUF1194 domain-containing protein [Oceanicella actignis]SET81972.1 Protein of unknown function [Oceanicella actignis]SHN75784.1 Protein of unknown function [Oceanicella actignis]
MSGRGERARRLIRWASAALLAAASPAASQAAGQAGGQEACRLALALAMDVSSSVDAEEYALQSRGLAAALRDEAVRAAMFAPGQGPVALAIYEWSGRDRAAMVAGWTLMRAPADADALAARVLAHPRSQTEFPTALGHALGVGAVLLRRAPPCARRTLDIASDGINNAGFGPSSAYKAFDFGGVTVNALVIGDDPQGLAEYYRAEVIRGPDAFVETARDHGDFARAMRRKLLRELAPPLLLGDAGAAAQSGTRIIRPRKRPANR